jgi:hypothetical protein
MKLFNSFFSKAVKAAPTLLPASGEVVYLEPTILGERKWVMHNGKVGIVTDLSGAGFAVVHFVRPTGETEYANRVPVGDLILAKHFDIPESRRHPDRVAAAALGYL